MFQFLALFFVRSFNKDGKLNQSIFIEHFPRCMFFNGTDLRTSSALVIESFNTNTDSLLTDNYNTWHR